MMKILDQLNNILCKDEFHDVVNDLRNDLKQREADMVRIGTEYKDCQIEHISTVDERIQSIESRLQIMDTEKIDQVMEQVNGLILEQKNKPHLKDTNRYNILIWGTDRWAERLLCLLPETCNIVAFADMKPEVETFHGERVVDFHSFIKLYKKTDFTILALNNPDAVITTLKESSCDCKRIYVCRGEEHNFTHVDKLDVGTWLPITSLFCDKSNNMRNMAEAAAYSLCDCKGVSYVVNSHYKTMVHDLSYDKNYQQEDIELFIHLAEEYYGIPSDTEGYFMDIGANIGTTSIWVKKKINSNLKLIAIEALRENCKQYRCNCILNDIEDDDYILCHAAVSDQETEMQLMLSNDNLGDNRVLIDGNYDEGRDVETVKTVCLDRWLKEKKINMTEIKYAWMDVQAHEAFAISGGAELFSTYDIPLFMEFWPEELEKNRSLDRLVSVLSKCYGGFINIDWLKDGDSKVYKINELYRLAEENADKSFDLFLVK